MLWLIRLGAYAVSGLVVWQFFDGGSGPVKMLAPARSLALDPEHGLVFGVCAGLANYTGFDVALIRLGWTLAVFLRGIGLVLYLVAFLLMP